MTKLDELRVAVLTYPAKTFTYADFKPIFGTTASSRLPDLVHEGTIQIVGQIKSKGLKAANVYALVDAPKKKPEQKILTAPIKEQRLRVVHWDEISGEWVEKSHPSYDEIPLCPDLLELLVLMNAAYTKPLKIGFANRRDR